jgi:hypothetical protein
MPTEKRSELLLKPWFDSNRRNALYEWVLDMMTDIGGVESISDLDDVDIDEVDHGMVLVYDEDAGDFVVDYPHRVIEFDGLYELVPESGPEKVLFITSDASSSIEIQTETALRGASAKYVIINGTTEGLVVSPALGVTIEAPDGTVAFGGGGYILTKPYQYATLHRLAQNEWYLEGADKHVANVNLLPDPEEVSSYTVQLEDINGVIVTNNALSNSVTVQEVFNVRAVAGDTIEIVQAGVGQTTIEEGSGVTILHPSDVSAALRARYSTATLRYVGSDTWYLSGDLDGV